MADTQVPVIVVIEAKDQASQVAEKIAKAYEAMAKASNTAAAANTKLGHAQGMAGHSMSSSHGAVEKLTHKMEHLARHTFMVAAGAIGVSTALHGVVEQTLEAAFEADNYQKKIAGVLVSFKNWKTGISDSTKAHISLRDGAEVFDELDQTAAKYGLRLQDTMSVFTTLAGPVMGRLGMTQKDHMEMTLSTIAAMRVLGVTGETAANKIAKVLSTKKIGRGVDEMSMKLRQLLGSTDKDVAKLSQGQIFERIQKGFAGMSSEATLFGQGLSGSFLRIKEAWDDFLRTVGGPTLRHVSQILERISKSFDGDGKRKLEVWGDKLLAIFERIEKVASFIVDHWKELAVVWAGMKFGKTIESLPGALGGFKGSMGNFGSNPNAKFMSMANLTADGLSKVTVGLSLFYGALQLGREAFENWHDKQVKTTATVDAFQTAVQKLGQVGKGESMDASKGFVKTALSMLQMSGLSDDKRNINTGGMIDLFNRMTGPQIIAAINTLPGAISEEMQNRLNLQRGQGGKEQFALANKKELAKSFGEYFTMSQSVLADGSTKVTETDVRRPPIQNFGDVYITQDFKDQDPDRVFIRFKNDLEGLADKPNMPSNAETWGQ